MSVIGPRPQLVRDMVFMTPDQRRRHCVKPGLSGQAQVNGRNGISWEEKLDWDLKYIEKITSSTLLTFVEIAILIFVILTTRRKMMSHYIMYGFLFLGIIWTYFTAPECRRIMTELFFEGSINIKMYFLLRKKKI